MNKACYWQMGQQVGGDEVGGHGGPEEHLGQQNAINGWALVTEWDWWDWQLWPLKKKSENST